jgi:RHS repeat-associated protein
VKKTTFSGYDPFGRPGTITPADGASHAITFTYAGVSSETRELKVGTGMLSTGGNVPETSVSVTRIHDRQGRLWRVNEPSGPAGAPVISEYTYDVGNRLVTAKTTAVEATQLRFFTYDNRGFLKTETHPEKNSVQVRYSKYDALGHAGRIEDVIGGPDDLSFFYDRAGRLTEVWESGGGSGRLLKSFLYAPANGPANFKNGKLEQAIRHNYVTLGTTAFDVELTQTYTYGGLNGRVSKRNTQLATNGQAGESFTQGFNWNALGQVSSLDYPRCTSPGCQQLFQDVPVGYPNKLEIEAIYPGITAGCGTNPLRYCPTDSITRGQMSVYLLLAKEGPGYVPPPCTGIFQDTPCGTNPYAPWVEEIFRRGITGGCSTTPRSYCPNAPVNNSEMAVFLITSLGVSPSPCPAAPFADVPCGAFASAFIAEEARRHITFGCGNGNFCPSAFVTRGDMAGLVVRAFGIALRFDPNTQRNVQFAYSSGFLTGVPGYASTISYNANGLVNQVFHSNGVTDTQTVDTTNWLARPLSISTSGAAANWSTGLYKYDGAGNITKMGTDWFQYDPVSRLVRGVVHDGLTGGGNEKQQTYTFDTYGNITGIATTAGGFSQLRQTSTNPATNRLSGAAIYDDAGNLTNWNGANYQYDPFNKMWRMQNGSEEWLYLYTADDERLWSFKTDGTLSRWTLRDLEGKVLREYDTVNSALWSIAADYVYRDGLLLAAETAAGPRHFHLDHLGTPRLITNAAAQQVAYHVYYPFGEEATAFNQDAERLKFTGHERDLASLAGAGDDLDYMHARFCSPVTGRFLSVDPVGGNPDAPQSWNRYNYVMNHSLGYTDPEGKFSLPAPFLINAINANLAFYFSDSITVKPCEETICQVVREVDRKAYKTGKLIEKGVMLELSALLTMGFGETVPMGELGLARITPKGARTFKSFSALKRAFGPAGPGKVWHHIVEQSQVGRFGAEAIHNTENVVVMTAEANTNLNALYSSIRPDITGSATQTVRQWLSTKSYTDAYQFGLSAIEKVLAGTWP